MLAISHNADQLHHVIDQMRSPFGIKPREAARLGFGTVPDTGASGANNDKPQDCGEFDDDDDTLQLKALISPASELPCIADHVIFKELEPPQ